MSNRTRDVPGVAVFGTGAPGPLRGLPRVELDDVADQRRIVVTGPAAELAAVLAALLRADRLDPSLRWGIETWEHIVYGHAHAPFSAISVKHVGHTGRGAGGL